MLIKTAWFWYKHSLSAFLPLTIQSNNFIPFLPDTSLSGSKAETIASQSNAAVVPWGKRFGCNFVLGSYWFPTFVSKADLTSTYLSCFVFMFSNVVWSTTSGHLCPRRQHVACDHRTQERSTKARAEKGYHMRASSTPHTTQTPHTHNYRTPDRTNDRTPGRTPNRTTDRILDLIADRPKSRPTDPTNHRPTDRPPTESNHRPATNRPATDPPTEQTTDRTPPTTHTTKYTTDHTPTKYNNSNDPTTTTPKPTTRPRAVPTEQHTCKTMQLQICKLGASASGAPNKHVKYFSLFSNSDLPNNESPTVSGANLCCNLGSLCLVLARNRGEVLDEVREHAGILVAGAKIVVVVIHRCLTIFECNTSVLLT